MAFQIPGNMAESAPTLAALKKLPLRQQSLILLARLKAINTQMRSMGGLNKNNLSMPAYGLAVGYQDAEASAVSEYVRGVPWAYLEKHGYLVDPQGHGFFAISEQGEDALNNGASAIISPEAYEAVEMLHHDLSPSQQDFREGKFMSAVASAFQKFENRLNVFRDNSSIAAVSGKDGTNLPHALFDFGVLKFPFPVLGAANQKRREAYLQALKNLMAGAIGFIRNAFLHEQHNLPALDEKSALELLFFASYLMRLLDDSTK